MQMVGSGVIEGLSDIVSRMRVGEEVEAWLHPRKAYHDSGNGAIPGGALLHFVSLRVLDRDDDSQCESLSFQQDDVVTVVVAFDRWYKHLTLHVSYLVFV